MSPEQSAHLRMMRDTLNPHDIRIIYRLGQYVLSFVDETAGLISWRCQGDLRAYKLGLDMRDNRKAYTDAKRGREPCRVVATPFFQSNLDQLEPA